MGMRSGAMCQQTTSGHTPSGYSGDSFALVNRVPVELIITHEEWRSQSYMWYLDSFVQQSELVSRVIGKACMS